MSLQCGSDSQELNVGTFQHSQHNRDSGQDAERFQQGQVPPKHSKGRCAVNDRLAPLLGMEAGEELLWVQWALAGRINIDELDALEPIQSFHERNFFSAKRALAVKPNLYLGVFAFHRILPQSG